MRVSIVVMVVAAFGTFAWFMLPAAPRSGPVPLSGGHAGHAGDPAAISEGTVLAVDRSSRSVTISHGALANLGMPAMTMVFQVADPGILEQVKPGDRVKFRADAVGGAFTASSIEIAN